MKPEQESLLLTVMEKTTEKFEKLQNKWWARAGVIYSVLILLLIGVIRFCLHTYEKVELEKEERHKLELRIQKLEARQEFENGYEHKPDTVRNE
jgi:hypothetical protein